VFKCSKHLEGCAELFIYLNEINKNKIFFVQCALMHSVSGVAEVKCQWGGRVLLRRPVAEGKKLFRWREVLVLMERSLLPEQFVSRVGGAGHYLPCPPQGPGCAT